VVRESGTRFEPARTGFLTLVPPSSGKIQLHLLRLIEIIVNHDRHRDLIRQGQSDGEVDIDEEWLKYLDLGLAGAKPAVQSDRACRQPPGGDRVSERELQIRPALVIGDQ